MESNSFIKMYAFSKRQMENSRLARVKLSSQTPVVVFAI